MALSERIFLTRFHVELAIHSITRILFAFSRILFHIFLHNYIDEHRYFVTSTLLTVTTRNKILKKANKHTINQPTNHIATNQPHTRVGSIRDHPFRIASSYSTVHIQVDRRIGVFALEVQHTSKRNAFSSLKVY